MARKIIYFDYAATTPLDSLVLKAMMPYLKSAYGNPSSIHYLGQQALGAMEDARRKVSDFLECSSREIIFTGSATEADNLALIGLVEKFKEANPTSAPHVITSQIEHDAILETCKVLEKQGAEVTYLAVNKEGLIPIADIDQAIRKNTILVSIMYANNEIGTIQPIAEIGRLLKKKNDELKYKIYFHTDAVQAINYLDCNIDKLGVDLLTLSGHKIYGPKGIGALYVRRETPLDPIIFGGGQGFGLRSGTENVAGIVGLGAAIEQVKNNKVKAKNIQKFRDKIMKGILKTVPDVKLNGSVVHRLPNNINFSFKGAEGEAIVILLDQEGICASTGSACSAKSLVPSHVLLALGLSEEEAHTSLRLSIGKYTTNQEVNKLLSVLPKIVKKLRKISGEFPDIHQY